MRAAILRAKSRERRIAIAAFLVLVFVVGSHALLETARDALFLSKVSASKLPWLYILIAIASILVTQLGARVRVRGAQSLTLSVAAASLITLGLGWTVPRFPVAGAYVLYTWTGVLIAVVLMRFWVLVGGLFTVSQAKALYGFIGTGSVMGAIVGSAAARALAELLPASQLVFAGAVSLGLGATVTLLFWKEGAVAADIDASTNESMRDCFRYVFEQRYAKMVALLLGLGAMALTLVDYLFKSIVAERVPPEELGEFFATVYLLLNIGSLVVQVAIVGWVVRRFNALGALAALPALIFIGSLGLILLPASLGLGFALGMKGVDGVMRHTLHRTASELLFVSLNHAARDKLKLFTDLVSQKGGQALVSVLILALAAVGGLFVLPWLLTALVALWLVALLATRGPYLALVRSQLRRHERPEGLPELDVESLAALVRALDSTSDQEVREAMTMLLEEDRSDLIPTLILYHPTDEVVIDALRTFAATERYAALPVIEKMATNRSCKVRSAALRASYRLGEEIDFQSLHDRTDSWFVKTTCACALSTRRALSPSEHLHLHETTASSDSELLVSLARDIAVFNSEHLAPYLQSLCCHDDDNIRAPAIEAIDVERFESHARLLLDVLGDENMRMPVYSLLQRSGAKTAELLASSLEDSMVPREVRRLLPSALARLPDPHEAAKLLVQQLRREKDGLIRYWLMRALDGLIARAPQAEPDLSWIEDEIALATQRAYRYLSRALVLSDGAEATSHLPAHGLLVRLLRDKQQQSIGRIFLLLDIQNRGENFISIWNSLRGHDERMRDAALEMLDNIVSEPLRSGLRGLVGDFTDAERLVLGERYHKHRPRTYVDVLTELEASQSRSARELTAHHRRELRTLDAPSLRALGDIAHAA